MNIPTQTDMSQSAIPTFDSQASTITPEILRAQARALWRRAEELDNQNRLCRITHNTASHWHIVMVAAEYYRLAPSDITGRRRTSKIAAARQLAVYLLRKETPLSFPAIGQLIGRKHSTIVYACERVEKSFLSRPTFEGEVRKMRQQIQARQGETSQAA